MSFTLHIFHTNDWHSHLDHWPRFAAYYQKRRHEWLTAGDDVLFFDLGDCVDRYEPWTEATQGQNMVQLLNALPTDAVTIGNNEGIGLSHDALAHLYDAAEFPVVLSNLEEATTGATPAFAVPHLVRSLKNGIKVGLFGLTAPYTRSYQVVGWQLADTDTVIARELNYLRDRVDIILFLSHLGVREDRRIAEKFPAIDVIFGAHSHHVLPTGEWVNDTLLTGGGKHGQYVGELTLASDNGKIRAKKEQLISLAELPAVPNEEETVARWHDKGRALLSEQVVATLPDAVPADERVRSPFQTLTLQAVCAETGVDLALLNSGLFLSGLTAGEVTKADLHRALPHPMRIVAVTLTGTELLDQLLPEIAAKQPILLDQTVTGFGFRGRIFGQLAFSADVSEATIERSRTYTLVTVDHILFLSLFPTLNDHETGIVDVRFLRELVADYLAKHYPKEGSHD